MCSLTIECVLLLHSSGAERRGRNDSQRGSGSGGGYSAHERRPVRARYRRRLHAAVPLCHVGAGPVFFIFYFYFLFYFLFFLLFIF